MSRPRYYEYPITTEQVLARRIEKGRCVHSCKCCEEVARQRAQTAAAEHNKRQNVKELRKK